GSAALSYSLPIALGIAALLAIVVISYRQTVVAYPQGGGAYLVAKDNLGIFPALAAAAALLVDYVLTVSVSVVAGVAALTSAVPHPTGIERLGLFLLLRSYAAGCTALTGVEAVSNGVQALKPPEGRNAQIVMTWLGVLSIAMFLGITYLAFDFGIVPGGDETV